NPFDSSLKELWGNPVAMAMESIREQEEMEEVLRDTRLQFERFNFWVMNKTHDWKSDPEFVKKDMRKVVAGAHDDDKHAAQLPWDKLWKDDPNQARLSRMMYDVYGLVESKDFTKNVKNTFYKFWAPKKKGELALKLIFYGGGIALSITTAGLG